MTSRPPLISNDLLSLPSAKTIVLSPSDRARRAFARVWARDAQRASGRGAVLLPRFMTIKSWIATTWEEAQLFGLIDDSRIPIASTIEMALWRHIAREVGGTTRAESAMLADRFAEAWTLEHGYRNATGHTAFAAGSSGELYRVARQAFTDALHRTNGITAAQLPFALSSELNAMRWISDQHFVDTPRFSEQKAELDLLSKLAINSKIALHNGANVGIVSSDSPRRVETVDPSEERAAAIAWALEKSAQRTALTRTEQVAIVVPDLQRTRGLWQRALREAGASFNISLGVPVSKYPWAAAGFRLVGAMCAPDAPETLAQALRHPRWGRSVATIEAINRREVELLRRGHSQVMLAEFCAPSIEALSALSQKIATIAPDFSRRKRYETRMHWRGVFERAIVALTDSPTALDSQTFQLREALFESIDAWQQLDDWLPQVSADDAQQELIAITDQAAFQPEGSEAPIQVIGLLESAGVPFDATWVAGLSQYALPETARTNPFLSAAWQKEHRVGLASVEQCDERARRLVAGWQALSCEVVASMPTRVDDEPQAWSPLVTDWRPLAERSRRPASPEAQQRVETIDDEVAPQWQPGSSRGVRALEAQAHCPRRGFAEGRLRLTAWPERSDGLSPQVRGELVHDVAERLGRALQAAPMQFDRLHEALPVFIRDAVDTASKESRHIPPYVWHAERTRLATVFERLLQFESARSAFTVVDIEKKVDTTLGALKLSLRVDRVDCVARIDPATGEITHDKFAVIDFKSGNVDRTGVLDDRLTAPQLPLYGHALGFETLSAVAYARVTDDHQNFVSFGDAMSGLEAASRGATKTPTWDALVEQWREKLARLADELIEGNAALAPAYGEKTCKKCDFQRFCRIDLSQLVDGDANDDDSQEEGGV